MRDAASLVRACGSWLRASAAVVAGVVVVTVLFSLAGTQPVLVTLRHALLHATLAGGLAALVLPRVMGRLARVPPLARWSLVILLLLALAGVGTVLACGILTIAAGGGVAACRTCVAGAYWITALMMGTLGLGMTAYETQRARLDEVTLELHTRQLEHERASKLALEARLAALEARLQPHFLFNTLNAISALIQADPDRAERTVERLAALLRFALDATERGLIPLADELKIVGDYLEIERTRLGERLSYAVDVEPAVAGCPIPPLAVQTLVENSIKHAIAPRPGGGRVRVGAAAAGDELVLTVWDDGPGFEPAAMLPGHGLDGLRGRLDGRFGGAARLTVGRRDGGTVVTVALPRGGNGRP